VTRHLGLLADLGLSGGDDCCAGPGVSLSRHSLGAELEAMPVDLGPLHLGVFAGGGVGIAGPTGIKQQGPLASGGALLELDVTSHMALTMRGGVSGAHLDSGWSMAETLTGGVAIY